VTDTPVTMSLSVDSGCASAAAPIATAKPNERTAVRVKVLMRDRKSLGPKRAFELFNPRRRSSSEVSAFRAAFSDCKLLKRNCGDAPRMGNFLIIVSKLGSFLITTTAVR
jgi:hypothetical protein